MNTETLILMMLLPPVYRFISFRNEDIETNSFFERAHVHDNNNNNNITVESTTTLVELLLLLFSRQLDSPWAAVRCPPMLTNTWIFREIGNYVYCHKWYTTTRSNQNTSDNSSSMSGPFVTVMSWLKANALEWMRGTPITYVHHIY